MSTSDSIRQTILRWIRNLILPQESVNRPTTKLTQAPFGIDFQRCILEEWLDSSSQKQLTQFLSCALRIREENSREGTDSHQLVVQNFFRLKTNFSKLALFRFCRGFLRAHSSLSQCHLCLKHFLLSLFSLEVYQIVSSFYDCFSSTARLKDDTGTRSHHTFLSEFWPPPRLLPACWSIGMQKV